jgi:hypothetical protein
MGSWKDYYQPQLKKIVYAINRPNLIKLIEDHEKRGWEQASEIIEYGYGLGILMIFEKGEKKHASNS